MRTSWVFVIAFVSICCLVGASWAGTVNISGTHSADEIKQTCETEGGGFTETGKCSGQECPPIAQMVVAETSNEFYTAKSTQEIVTAPGVKVTTIQGQNGQSRVALVARNNGDRLVMTCTCTPGGCSSQCRTERIDDSSTINTFRCSGTCSGYAGCPGGSCGWLSGQNEWDKQQILRNAGISDFNLPREASHFERLSHSVPAASSR
jgi:hypothetical protein